MKTAISIPDKIYHNADLVAERLGVSRSELYVTALQEFLLQHSSDKVTEKLNEVYQAIGSKLDSSLKTMQFKSLPREKW